MILKFKTFLTSTLGWFGYVLFYTFYFTFTILVVFPGIIFLDLPFLVKIIFYVAVFCIPSFVFNLIIQFLVWGFSLPVVLFSPFDIFSLYYYICFAVFLITTVIVPIINIIRKKRNQQQ